MRCQRKHMHDKDTHHRSKKAKLIIKLKSAVEDKTKPHTHTHTPDCTEGIITYTFLPHENSASFVAPANLSTNKEGASFKALPTCWIQRCAAHSDRVFYVGYFKMCEELNTEMLPLKISSAHPVALPRLRPWEVSLASRSEFVLVQRLLLTSFLHW